MGLTNFTQKVTCLFCGAKDTVSVITKETKYSRSVKVTKCTNCERQQGVKATLDLSNNNK